MNPPHDCTSRKSIVASLALILILCIAGVLAGCKGGAYDAVNSQLKAENVILGMRDKDVVDKLGGDGEVAPCVQGYERSYGDLGLVVGFDQDSETVRRINVRKPEQMILGISPGSSVDDASASLLDQGFSAESGSRSKFLRDDLRVTITSFDEVSVAEVAIEVRETR